MPYKQKNGTYRATKMIQGQRKTRVFQTRREAVEWEVAQDSIPLQTGTSTDCSLIEWATAYLDYCKTKYSPKTFGEKRLSFRMFCKEHNPDTPAKTITPALCLKHLTAQAEERTHNAANKDRKNLSSGWNWGVKFMNLPSHNPFLDVERFGHDETPRQVPVPEELEAVMSAAKILDPQGWRMLITLLHTAARISEITAMKWEDVDFEGRKIRLYTRKRKGGRLEADWLPMTGELHHVLSAQLSEKTSDIYVFAQTTGQKFTTRRFFMKWVCKKAGVDPFGFHAIRHYTASKLAEAGVPLPMIQAILRHKSVSTTAKYIRNLNGAVSGQILEEVFAPKPPKPPDDNPPAKCKIDGYIQ